jgi:hypothetical protein
MKKKIEVEVDVVDNKEQLNTINTMLEDDTILKLIKLGYYFQSAEEAPAIKDLKGVKSWENGMILVDKSYVSLYADNLKMDESKVLVTIPMSYLKIAFDIGMDEVCITEKDYPVFCKKGDKVLVIAPRVSNKDC